MLACVALHTQTTCSVEEKEERRVTFGTMQKIKMMVMPVFDVPKAHAAVGGYGIAVHFHKRKLEEMLRETRLQFFTLSKVAPNTAAIA
jgi:hypothetical protein